MSKAWKLKTTLLRFYGNIWINRTTPSVKHQSFHALLTEGFMNQIQSTISNDTSLPFVGMPIYLIEDSIRKNQLNSLSYYVQLKNLHRNNTFYKFSLRSVAKQINVSHSCLKHHLAILEKLGLIRYHAGNLTLTSLRKIKETYKGKVVKINKANSIPQQTIILRAITVIKNIESQKRIIAGKSDIKTTHEATYSKPSDIRRIKKLERKLNFNPENKFCDKTILSHFGFGKLINRSLSTGKRFQKQLKDSGIIATAKNIQLYCNAQFNRKGFYSLELDGSYFLSNKGYVYKRYANEVAILKSWVIV